MKIDTFEWPPHDQRTPGVSEPRRMNATTVEEFQVTTGSENLRFPSELASSYSRAVSCVGGTLNES